MVGRTLWKRGTPSSSSLAAAAIAMREAQKVMRAHRLTDQSSKTTTEDVPMADPMFHSQVIHVGKDRTLVPPPIKPGKRNQVTRRFIDLSENHKQTNVAYFGYADHSRHDVMEVLAETIVRNIAKRVGAPFTTYDSVSEAFPLSPEKIGGIAVKANLQLVFFKFRRDAKITDQFRNPNQVIAGQPAVVQDNENLSMYWWGPQASTLGDMTLSAMVAGVQASTPYTWGSGNPGDNTLKKLTELLAIQLESKAEQGFVLDDIIGFDHSGQGSGYLRVFEMKNMSDAQMDLRVKQNIRIQNVTPGQRPGAASGADAEGYNKNDITHNPLDGKCYRFRNATPRFRQDYREDIQYKGQALTELEVPTKKGILSTKCLRELRAFNGAYVRDEFQTPPSIANIFSNGVGTSKVHVLPGNYLVLNTNFTYRGTMGHLLLGLSTGVNTYNTTGKTLTTVGDCYMFALRNAVRGENDCVVQLVCNRRQSYMCDYDMPKYRNIVVPYREQRDVTNLDY